MGSANAAVLPLPVSAMPSTSSPASARGMHRRCTAVGRRMPRASHVSTSH
uniref:Uncharacterized protein n=1 Tax=Arundo donax TaxID=35708 RepID=A0A0A9EE83_ARUDO